MTSAAARSPRTPGGRSRCECGPCRGTCPSAHSAPRCRGRRSRTGSRGSASRSPASGITNPSSSRCVWSTATARSRRRSPRAIRPATAPTTTRRFGPQSRVCGQQDPGGQAPRRRRYGRLRDHQGRFREPVALDPTLVEPERRVLVALSSTYGDAYDPAIEPDDDVEEPAGVPRGEQQRHAARKHEDADQSGLEADAPEPLVDLASRIAATAEEDAGDDVVRDREEPPLHEHEAA